MLYGVPFKAEHLQKLTLQYAQQWVSEYLIGTDIRMLENEWAGTLMEDGKPIACVGPWVYWENRAYVWSFVGSQVTTKKFLEVHHLAKRYLDGLPFRRLEAAVDVNFLAAHRWVKVLGFTLEAPCMKAFQVDGRNCALYARVRV